jgi:hypothetical protein
MIRHTLGPIDQPSNEQSHESSHFKKATPPTRAPAAQRSAFHGVRVARAAAKTGQLGDLLWTEARSDARTNYSHPSVTGCLNRCQRSAGAAVRAVASP